ncbi:hypothetical protein M3223_08425 [Paenibacillus pasadenensis]|uniref:hypothetical protein n=1 Tax=Paenibacillus pasadenensis TaxID=217090 RepID=UPI002041628F|nr:hypothetical protein [Paenibacillus pasadenensis]MCM3747379.1 hypothetical protein [Paenibacillus pasadenensis]
MQHKDRVFGILAAAAVVLLLLAALSQAFLYAAGSEPGFFSRHAGEGEQLR